MNYFAFDLQIKTHVTDLFKPMLMQQQNDRIL